MPMRFLGKLSIFLIILTFPNFLPPAKSVLCPLVAWGYERSDFGRNGQDGTDGRSGKDGRSGENQTIFADNSAVNLDLSGTDGEDGDDGGDGDNAFFGKQPYRVERNLHAANGGDGGDAGNGGDGGNGGSLTVYYKDLADLRQIAVRATGGEGGRAGRAGKSGYGCDCDRHEWEVETCTGTPGSSDYKCNTRRFYCQDGKNGRKGSSGKNGKKGSLGTLTLINRKEPLAADAPTIKVRMPELKDKVFTLSKNIWNTRTGAGSLLAPGSAIADEYREFVERLESPFQLVWNEARPLTDFGNETVTINLEDDKRVKTSFPEDVWVKGEELQQNGITQFVVSNAIHQREVTQLKVADFSGNGSNLNLSLIDSAGKSDLVSTQFSLKYRSTPSDARFNRYNASRSDYKTRYEGNIPAELISRNKNRFTLNLGKLPISSEFLQPGVAADIELVATRSLGDRSTKQKINWNGEIIGR